MSADIAVPFPGILAIFNNVASGREAEFEEWFQREHLAERLNRPSVGRPITREMRYRAR
jgi:hypothetical protein